MPSRRNRPLSEVVLGDASTQPIPHCRAHEVQPLEAVCCSLAFLAIDERSRAVIAHEVGVDDCPPQG